jgi:flagellar motility protein MotE (MotC chaperone)
VVRRHPVLVAWLVVAGLAIGGARARAEEKGAAKKDVKAEAKAEPPSEKGAKAEAGKDAKKEAKAEPAKDAKDTKGEKAPGKAEAKAETKTDSETESKGSAKTDAKNDSKSAAKAEAKADTKSEAKAGSKADAKADPKKDPKTAHKAGSSRTPGAKSGEGGEEQASGPLTPPLKLSALHEEMSHPPVRHDEHPATKAEREKLEQLAAEINKAREGLRKDTAKLEAMLAARDAAPPPVASAGTPSGGDSGEPQKKVPTPLDNLSKAIRGMKPEQAAPIISRVDRKLAADILLRMPGADAGKVMGVCKPEVAAELAAEIASRTPRAELKR